GQLLIQARGFLDLDSTRFQSQQFVGRQTSTSILQLNDDIADRFFCDNLGQVLRQTDDLRIDNRYAYQFRLVIHESCNTQAQFKAPDDLRCEGTRQPSC